MNTNWIINSWLIPNKSGAENIVSLLIMQRSEPFGRKLDPLLKQSEKAHASESSCLKEKRETEWTLAKGAGRPFWAALSFNTAPCWRAL